MNNYMVFGGEEYDTPGGMRDFIDSFSDLDIAIRAGLIMMLSAKDMEWAHIYSIKDKCFIAHLDDTDDPLMSSDDDWESTTKDVLLNKYT